MTLVTDAYPPAASSILESRNPNQRLVHRRQFLLAASSIPGLSHWHALEFAGFHLYTHPDLEVNKASAADRTIVLVGYLFDSTSINKSNAEILADILHESESFASFLVRIKRNAGRYVLLYQDAQCLKLVHDPLGLREVYYSTKPNLVICGSQPNLLARYSSPSIERTNDPDVLEFYTHHFGNAKWIGEDTLFRDVKHLLPNHCLDLRRLEAVRYWPTEKIKPIPLDEAVDISCAHLEGMIQAALHRFQLMMAITAGTDSRTMLAAARGVREKLYFFVNKERSLTEQSPDIRVPREICARLGIDFHVHEVAREVDSDFRNVFLTNTCFASDRILPTIYNVYFRTHPEKVNLLGIGEIGRTRYGKEPTHLTPYRLAYALGYKKSRYVVKVCERLMPEMEAVGRKCGVNVLTLLYWEQMMGNWGAVGNSESDIAIEEFDPYNSHRLYETFLGVDPRYADYYDNIFFKKMIAKMWPELLDWPINPPVGGIKDRAEYFLKHLGVFPIFKRLKYACYCARYRNLGKTP